MSASAYADAGHGPAAAFYLAISRVPRLVVVTAHGRLDASASTVLRAALMVLIEVQRNPAVVVDTSGMTFVDPSLFDLFADPAAAACRHGSQLSIAGPTDATTRALEAVGLVSTVAVARRRLQAVDPPLDLSVVAERRRASMAQHPSGGAVEPHHQGGVVGRPGFSGSGF